MERLREEFLAFHRDNPWVYDRLLRRVEQIYATGRRKYSMRTLLSVARFDRDLETTGEDVPVAGGEERRVKLNDHHSPYYARLVAYKNPHLRDFFEYRRVAGEVQGEVILFSDVPGEPDLVLGEVLPAQPRRRRLIDYFLRRR